ALRRVDHLLVDRMAPRGRGRPRAAGAAAGGGRCVARLEGPSRRRDERGGGAAGAGGRPEGPRRGQDAPGPGARGAPGRGAGAPGAVVPRRAGQWIERVDPGRDAGRHLTGRSAPPLGVYIHVPFCARRCDYCDFFVVPGTLAEATAARYTTVVMRELQAAIAA